MPTIERVLLVDDDATSLYIAKRLLKDAAREPIQTAVNGAEALEIVKGWIEQQQLPQLILSDVFMPVMDGMDFVDELEKLLGASSKHVKVMLISENSSDVFVEWKRQRPRICIMDKPLTREKVLEMLGEMMPA